MKGEKLPPVTMRLADAAQAIGVSRSTMWRWVTDGNVRGFRVGKHWVIDLESLRKMLGPEATTLLRL